MFYLRLGMRIAVVAAFAALVGRHLGAIEGVVAGFVLVELLPERRWCAMAKIVEAPAGKRVKCRGCRATIEYMPEEVESHHGRDISGGPDGWERVKCPRPGCPDYGYISCW